MGDNQSQGGPAGGLSTLLGQQGIGANPRADVARTRSDYGMYRDATGAMQQDRSMPAPPGTVGGPPMVSQGKQDRQGSASSQQLNAIKQMAGGANPGVSPTPVLPTPGAAVSRPATVRTKPGVPQPAPDPFARTTTRNPFAQKPIKGFGVK